jgi:hypothetical protein
MFKMENSYKCHNILNSGSKSFMRILTWDLKFLHLEKSLGFKSGLNLK